MMIMLADCDATCMFTLAAAAAAARDAMAVPCLGASGCSPHQNGWLLVAACCKDWDVEVLWTVALFQ